MDIPREELLATRYERAFAFVLDVIILAAVGAVVGFLLTLFGVPEVAAAIVGLVLGLLWWPLWVSRDGEHNGQTPAKQLIGLRAMRLNREPFDFGSALVREGLIKHLVVGFTAYLFLLISWAFSFGRGDRRTLHDRMVGTIVVCDAKRWVAPPADVVPAPASRAAAPA